MFREQTLCLYYGRQSKIFFFIRDNILDIYIKRNQSLSSYLVVSCCCLVLHQTSPGPFGVKQTYNNKRSVDSSWGVRERENMHTYQLRRE